MNRKINKWDSVATVVLTAAGLVGVLTACSQKEPAPADRPAAAADDSHGLHMINNKRLRLIMDQFRALDLDAICRQMEAGGHPDRRIEEVATMAADLASDARAIPMTFKNTEMNDESRRVFDRLAARLGTEATELGELARRQDARRIKGKLDELIHTCNECHSSFRGPTIAAAPPAAESSVRG